MQEAEMCFIPVPGALGSALTAVSTPEISAGFQEQLGRWQSCVCPCTIPFAESPALNLIAPGGFVIHVLSWHWRSPGEKGSDAADVGHQHHLLPVLIQATLKARKISWSQKEEKNPGCVIWDSCCLLVIKFVTILTELGTMEGIRKKRQKEGKYNKSHSGAFSFWFYCQGKWLKERMLSPWCLLSSSTTDRNSV